MNHPRERVAEDAPDRRLGVETVSLEHFPQKADALEDVMDPVKVAGEEGPSSRRLKMLVGSVPPPSSKSQPRPGRARKRRVQSNLGVAESTLAASEATRSPGTAVVERHHPQLGKAHPEKGPIGR